MRSTLWKQLNINWSACHLHVFQLQSRIAIAWLDGDHVNSLCEFMVTRLQNDLVRSFAARALGG